MHKAEWELFRQWRETWNEIDRVIFGLTGVLSDQLQQLPCWTPEEAAAWVLSVSPQVIDGAEDHERTPDPAMPGARLRRKFPVHNVLEFFRRMATDNKLHPLVAAQRFYEAHPFVDGIRIPTARHPHTGEALMLLPSGAVKGNYPEFLYKAQAQIMQSEGRPPAESELVEAAERMAKAELGEEYERSHLRDAVSRRKRQIRRN